MDERAVSGYTQPFVSTKEKLMAATESKKCAHPICTCKVTSGKYCSTQCEAMEKTPDVDCTCNHPACKGRTE